MKIFIKSTTALLLISFLLLFCGCTAHVGLSDYLLIDVIGLDFNIDTVTVTVLFTDADLQNGADESKTEYTALSEEGESISQALNQIESKTGKTPLYAHAGLLLIGNITDTRLHKQRLDFFIREYTTRCDILTAASTHKAAFVLQNAAKSGEQGVNNLLYMMKYSQKNAIAPLVKFFHFFNLLLSENNGAYCPVLEPNTQDKDLKNPCFINGTAVFSNDNSRVTLLSTEQTKALLLLTNRAKHMPIAVSQNGFSGNLTIIKEKLTVKTDTENNPSVRIILKAACRLTECKAPKGNFGETQIQKAAEETAAYLCDLLSEVYGLLTDTAQADVCRLNDRERLKPFHCEKGTPICFQACFLTVSVTITQTGMEQISYGNE